MSTHDVSSINICIHKRTHDTTTITKIDNVTFFRILFFEFVGVISQKCQTTSF